MDATGGERAFWEDIRRKVADGVLTVPTGAPRVFDGSELLIYVADLKTGWIKAGAYRQTDMEVAQDVASQPSWSETTLPLLAELVSTAAEHCASETEPIVLQALGLAMAAVAASTTYGVVLRDREICAGHWFFVVYTATDGSRAWNTAFAATALPGFLGGVDLATFLRRVLATNLAGGADVAERMRAGGGLRLAPSLASLLVPDC